MSSPISSAVVTSVDDVDGRRVSMDIVDSEAAHHRERVAAHDGGASNKNALSDILATLPSLFPQAKVIPHDHGHVDTTFSEDMKTSSNSTAIPSISEKNIEHSLEKGNPMDDYDEDELPEKTHGKVTRNLRYQVFTLYRRLFSVVFLTNLAIFIATVARGGTNASHLGTIVIANLFTAIVMRNAVVINAWYAVFCAVPLSWPLFIRRFCARVYHIGGIHSGCAISGTAWLIYLAEQATRELVNHGKTSIATVVITYIIIAVVVGIILFAYPKARTSHHDNFEWTHRFLGWTAVALVWAQVILLINDYRQPEKTLGHAVVRAPTFWLVLIMTISIAMPWMRLKKRSVHVEKLSDHAIRLYFDYADPIPGMFIRLSSRPLFEWHGFATIAEPGKKGFSAVISRAGDWTSKQISAPPKEIWVRDIPTEGMIGVARCFRRVIMVATGSGIGPCTPGILKKQMPIRLLWTAPNVRQTFGDKLVDTLLEASPDAVIWDTRKQGKPDMVKLAYKMYQDFNAEAVCIISNGKLTRKVVYGLNSRGVPAFGAIWDS